MDFEIMLSFQLSILTSYSKWRTRSIAELSPVFLEDIWKDAGVYTSFTVNP